VGPSPVEGGTSAHHSGLADRGRRGVCHSDVIGEDRSAAVAESGGRSEREGSTSTNSKARGAGTHEKKVKGKREKSTHQEISSKRRQLCKRPGGINNCGREEVGTSIIGRESDPKKAIG